MHNYSIFIDTTGNNKISGHHFSQLIVLLNHQKFKDVNICDPHFIEISQTTFRGDEQAESLIHEALSLLDRREDSSLLTTLLRINFLIENKLLGLLIIDNDNQCQGGERGVPRPPRLIYFTLQKIGELESCLDHSHSPQAF